MIIALSCSNSTVKIKQSFLFEAILFSSVLGNVTEMYSTIFWARTWEAIFFFSPTSSLSSLFLPAVYLKTS